MRNNILGIILFFNLSLCFSQYNWTPGKINLKNGEVLQGIIKIPRPSIPTTPISIGKSKVKYKKDKKSKIKKFDESQIDKVYFGTSNQILGYYEYIPLTRNKMRLFKLIRNGKVKLYTRSIITKRNNNFGDQNNYPNITIIDTINQYYVIRKNENVATDVLYSADFRSFKNTIKKYLSDCEDIATYIENDIYIKFDIEKIIEDYNLICD